MLSRAPDPPYYMLPPPFGPNSTSKPGQTQQAVFPTPNQSSILTPKTNRDVLALLFLLLLLPQGISCIVLTGYILLGSFRTIAGRTISRYLGLSDSSSEYELEAKPTVRYNFYRSELIGDCLQLFSINSFILLVCHYTLPTSWIKYAIVLAKSIVASRLVGSYTTGSTTYVSVVSNAGGSTTTTTSTTFPGSLTQSGTIPQKSDSKFYTSSLLNSLIGFLSVISINYIVKNWLLVLNIPLVLSDIAKFYRNLANASGDQNNYEFSYSSLFLSLFTQSPFFVSYNYLASKKAHFTLDDHKFLGKNTVLTQLVIHICMNYLHLGETSIRTIALLLRETTIVVNYAYLVLCIHVISLTVSPFLLRIFILKDYSKTLDHLSSLTPYVPYSAFKKTGTGNNLAREATSTDSVVVINMEQNQLQQQMALKGHSEPPEMKLDAAVANSEFSLLLASQSVSASNFKIFCMVPAPNKSCFGNKTNHNRTIIDRKRSNSNATPSTTIMDKYFTISIQPIWSWLAAIKILFASPKLFAGQPTTHKSNGQKFINGSVDSCLPMAIASIADSRVVFEVLDQDQFESALLAGFSVRVNSVFWPHVRLFSEESSRKLLLCIYGLTPLYQYEINLSSEGRQLSHYVVNTTSADRSTQISCSLESSPIQTLQSSLKHTIETLNSLKATFRKIKKDEHKRTTELKKQIDSLKSKIDKYGNREANEGRVSGKLKGLQNSITQLVNEIEQMERLVMESELTNEGMQREYKEEEEYLSQEIASLEKKLAEHELDSAKMKNDVKTVQSEKSSIEAKKKKSIGKYQVREEEIARLNMELKTLKKAMIAKLQRRQKRVHDRFETILPKVNEAIDNLKADLSEYFNENEQRAIEASWE